jgi:hypothetical protein
MIALLEQEVVALDRRCEHRGVCGLRLLRGMLED